ncbi:hypothetical protein HDE_02712 [Halotydeus destructor]|nr:hypothetical protein HDE_02712 [Halotydeus destructor]
MASPEIHPEPRLTGSESSKRTRNQDDDGIRTSGRPKKKVHWVPGKNQEAVFDHSDSETDLGLIVPKKELRDEESDDGEFACSSPSTDGDSEQQISSGNLKGETNEELNADTDNEMEDNEIDFVDKNSENVKMESIPSDRRKKHVLVEVGRHSDQVEYAVDEEMSEEIIPDLPRTVQQFLAKILLWSIDDRPYSLVSRKMEEELEDLAHQSQEDPKMFSEAFLRRMLIVICRKLSSLDVQPSSESHFLVHLKYFSNDEFTDLADLYCSRTFGGIPQECLKKGELVLITVFEFGNQASSACIGFVQDQGIRRVAEDIGSEMADIKIKGINSSHAMSEDVVIRCPAIRELCLGETKVVNIQKLFMFTPYLDQVNTLYKLPENNVFRGLAEKSFIIPPSGCGITSNFQEYSENQLNAIQKTVDLTINPCSVDFAKLLLFTGRKLIVQDTLCEILLQLLTHSVLPNRQYILVSNNKVQLFDYIRKFLKSKVGDSRKFIYYCYGHKSTSFSVDQRCIAYAELTIKEIDEKSKNLNVAPEHLEECLRVKALQQSVIAYLRGGRGEPEVINGETVRDIVLKRERAQLSLVQAADLVIGTFEDLSNDVDFRKIRAPKSKKRAESQDDSKKKIPADVVLCDSSLNILEVHGLASLFPFRKYVIAQGSEDGDNEDTEANVTDPSSKLLMPFYRWFIDAVENSDVPKESIIFSV